jgi:hypothetical protein
MGITGDLHAGALVRELPGDLDIEGSRERVSGDQQAVQRLGSRRHRRQDRGRLAGTRPSGLEALSRELLVGREPGGQVLAGIRQRQSIGDPPRRAADRLDDVPAESRLKLV